MKKVLFITNIPAPYRIDFYNELGKYVDLTVLFEAKGASDQGIRFNWNLDRIEHFKPIFLSDGDIKERKVDWSIFKYLGRKKYDEIVVTNYSYFTEMVALLYLKIMHIPYYMETDGGIIRKENRLKRIYKRILVSGAKGYFSPSEQSDNYLEYYGADRRRVYRYPFTSLYKKNILPNAITRNDKISIRSELNMVGEHIVLGVGQMIYRKGWDVLISAASMTTSDIHYYIAGGQPPQEYFELMEKSNIQDRIHFIPFVTADVLKQYYMAADIFVLPTREDIWGLVINEALAYSLPVITTSNCVAGLELIKNGVNGRIVDVGDIEMLAESINELVHSSSYNEMAEMAVQSIKSHTIEEMAEIHEKIFNG